MILFLDTSVFERENFFKGRKIDRLFDFSLENHIDLKITEITYREIKKRIEVNINKVSQKLQQLNRSLGSEGKIVKNLDISTYQGH